MPKSTTPVLVIDDEILMITVITKILERLGYGDVDYAADGLTAIEKMRARPYGLVICDWKMEPISGYDVLRQVRGDQNLRDIPFIMATTQTVMQNAIAAKTAGVSGYLIKPFTPGSLQRSIEAAVGPLVPAQPPLSNTNEGTNDAPSARL
jgi:two-component system, chemotaxis family, chemotaxis protein CheY